MDAWNLKTHPYDTSSSIHTSYPFPNSSINWEPDIQIYDSVKAILI